MGAGLTRRAKPQAPAPAPRQDYPCTSCGGDAYIGVSAGRKPMNWGGLVKRGERLCFTCFRKRGGENVFGR